jgi:hypothetical protein
LMNVGEGGELPDGLAIKETGDWEPLVTAAIEAGSGMPLDADGPRWSRGFKGVTNMVGRLGLGGVIKLAGGLGPRGVAG